MAKVTIDTKKCIEIAEHISSSGGVPKDQEDPMALSFPPRVAHNAWCAVVAINQQTTPVVGKALQGTVEKKKLRGWDYLLQKAIYESNKNPQMFTVDWLCGVTAELLKEIYIDEREGETLGRLEDRAMLLEDLGIFLKGSHFDNVHEIYVRSGGYIIRNDGSGIAQVLSRTRAYQDPVQKKLFYFLAIMKNQGLWTYEDSISLGPPVNYHEQRGHLRLGTIRILDQEFESVIRNRGNIGDQEDIEIRSAVRRAIEFIAQLLEVTPSMMHYYFWNHFRNCCSRSSPHCQSCGNNCSLPVRYRLTPERRCVFTPVCASATLPADKMFIEPRIDNTLWQ